VRYVVDYAGIFVGVSAWERDAFWQLDCALAFNFNLDAVWVELCASPWVLEVGDLAFMESNHFGANKIATSRY
jgi:hypothetical protein